MQLREHQQKAIDGIRQSFRTGNRKVLLSAPCSFGKTHTAASILKSVQDKGKRGIFYVDRLKLLDQTFGAFDDWGIDYGVIQGDCIPNPNAPIQIASIQTVTRRGFRRLDYDLAIVDECHVIWKTIVQQMEAFDALKFIGLTATPYTKGLGTVWQDMVSSVTQEALLEKGYLAPVHYYGGASVDTAGVRRRKISTGTYDYHPDDIAERSESDNQLTGDIIRNWLEHGENAQTIAFCPSIKMSKGLVNEFQRNGIPAGHIDGYASREERKKLFDAHESGEIKILSCSQLLGVGYDSPKTRVLIDCYPTKSPTVFQQRAGRIQRIHPDKPYAIYLDHAQNVRRFGFAHLMEPDSLCQKERKFSEANQLVKKDKKETVIRNCPQCAKIMQGLKCICGYEYLIIDIPESDCTMLTRIDKASPVDMQIKRDWMLQLYSIALDCGYKHGWAAHKYKEKFGVWPKGHAFDMSELKSAKISETVLNFVRSRNIAYAKGKKKSPQYKNLEKILN